MTTQVVVPCVGAFEAVNGELCSIPVDVALQYDPDRPYTAVVVFSAAEREPVVWCFARDLLDQSRREQGIGDVTVRVDGHRVLLLLRSEHGTAVVALPREAVDVYLARSWALVPVGTESEHLDVDLGLRRLLDGPDGYVGRHSRAHDPDQCRQCRRRGGVR